MWWCDPRFLLGAVAALWLAGCGFEPVYGPGASAPGFQKQIQVEPGRVRRDFEFRERLVERIGHVAGDSRYTLSFSIDVQETRLALEVGGQFSRNSLFGTAHYSIVDSASGDVVHEGQVTGRAAYGATAETYPTQVAAEDAEIRLVRLLADLIVSRIELTYGSWPE